MPSCSPFDCCAKTALCWEYNSNILTEKLFFLRVPSKMCFLSFFFLILQSLRITNSCELEQEPCNLQGRSCGQTTQQVPSLTQDLHTLGLRSLLPRCPSGIRPACLMIPLPHFCSGCPCWWPACRKPCC